MKKIHRIVITGGPCAGKTTAFARIKSELSEKGYKVFVVSETFTDMFEGGIKLLDYPSLDFQSMLLRQQIAKEEMYYNAAIKHKNNKIVILYDRGVLDPIAYMDSDIASLMLELGGYKINELKARYDAVIHLVTAAEGAKEAFLANRANNTARYENVEQAIEADKKLLAVWTGHSHLRVIDNSTDFDRKITRLMEEIYSILGIPTPLEIERKFLIEMPDIKMLISKFNVSSSDIVQTYLCDNGGGYERRIRQRGKAGDYNYYYTEKRRISESVRLENERLITEKEYLELLMQSDFTKKQIRKTRYCFVWNNQYFELDVYPFWEDVAILEIELTHEETKIGIPTFLNVIREVTKDTSYSNFSLASKIVVS